MRVMVFVKATKESEADFVSTPESRAALADMERFNDELRTAGVLLMAKGLQPSSQGKRVAFDGADRIVSDGPFPNPEELVAGFWLWKVTDMDEAIAWVRRCPNPMLYGPSVIEIRPIEDEL